MIAHQLDENGVIINNVVVDNLTILPNLIAYTGRPVGVHINDPAPILIVETEPEQPPTDDLPEENP